MQSTDFVDKGTIMKDKYYEQAVTCVKDTVLPAQIKLYNSCGGDF